MSIIDVVSLQKPLKIGLVDQNVCNQTFSGRTRFFSLITCDADTINWAKSDLRKLNMLPCASLEFNISNSINGIKISSFLTLPHPEITIGRTGSCRSKVHYSLLILFLLLQYHILYSLSLTRGR